MFVGGAYILDEFGWIWMFMMLVDGVNVHEKLVSMIK